MLENGEFQIEVTLRRPTVVTKDRGYIDRKCFYRKLYVPGVRKESYLKVVVEYDETDRDNVYGEVISPRFLRILLIPMKNAYGH